MLSSNALKRLSSCEIDPRNKPQNHEGCRP